MWSKPKNAEICVVRAGLAVADRHAILTRVFVKTIHNNVYVYPSVSASVVFSEFIKNKKLVNYGKLRASVAQVGSDTDPYQLVTSYTNSKYSYAGYAMGLISNSVQPNADLKPTKTNSFEIGLEMKFFNESTGGSG